MLMVQRSRYNPKAMGLFNYESEAFMALKETSKYMSLILRHKVDTIGIWMDAEKNRA